MGAAANKVSLALVLLAGLAASAPPALAQSTLVSGGSARAGSVYSELTIDFNCEVTYIDHDPAGDSEVVRVQIEVTSLCYGVPPSVAEGREMIRPLGADEIGLNQLEYIGDMAGSRVVRLEFDKPVTVMPPRRGSSRLLSLRLIPRKASGDNAVAASNAPGRRIARPAPPTTKYVINLESSQRYPAAGDIPSIRLDGKQKLFISEAQIDGKTWYRMRLGYFASAEEASRVLRELRADYPTAWIDRDAGDDAVADLKSSTPAAAPATSGAVVEPIATAQAPPPSGNDPGALMQEARRLMMAGDLSRAIQYYTKILQLPPNEFQRDAQEFLGLARERNGQIAHAKAEYERYIALYPDDEHAERVQQRLATLLATPASARADSGVVASNAARSASRDDNWKLRSFLSQHYRRDVNQLNEQEQVTSQSSLYTDVTVDARRRGERFDFSARLSAGHRYDMLDEERVTSGNDVRVSYLYADLFDTRTQLRGRLGRQTRNTGGVLGRFDGLNLTYSMNERLRFEAVAGEPVYSTTTSDTQSREFYGVSSSFSPFGPNFEVGMFYLQQWIESMTDRRAVGTEMRYFGDAASVWGSVDYDLEFGELGSAFLQGSWRLPGKFTLSGSLDRRRSPFLSLGNILNGQQNQDFLLIAQSLPEEELRSIALERSGLVSSASLGLSRPLSPRLQFSLSLNRSIMDAMPAFGDAPAMPETEYSYYSADFVASSFLKEGDVGIFSLRYATSDSANVYTINLDSRFPFGTAWRISPRLRVDYREFLSDGTNQVTYTPGLRLQYRLGRRGRVDLETGKSFASREMAAQDLDRESYFISLGYQLFY